MLKSSYKALVVAALGMFFPFFSYAAPELFITWKADSYVPRGYAGKALGVAGTPIEAKVILIDGIKTVSLAPYSVTWYAGEDRIAGGTGMTSVRTILPTTGQDELELRASIGKYNDQPLDAFVTIPVVRPKLLIRKKTDAQQGFSALPYFWNIKSPEDLLILWTDNGESITARATHKNNPLEFAQTTTQK